MEAEDRDGECWEGNWASYKYGQSQTSSKQVEKAVGNTGDISDDVDGVPDREQLSDEGCATQNMSNRSAGHIPKGAEVRRWSALMNAFGLTRSPTELTRDDMVGKDFVSIQHAEDFFYLYGRLVGFGVRRGHMRKNSDGHIRYRTWLCCKQGHRQEKHFQRIDRIREPKQLSREGCKVQLRISYSKKRSKWVVREFFTSHCHPVAMQSQIGFIRAYRKISKGTQTKAKAMHRSGMRTSRILSYMGQLAGGYDRLGFWPKDLQNSLQKDEKEKLCTCDAAASIGYLQHKAEHAVGFFAKYTYDADNRLQNLLWSDTMCQQAYKEFGDTLAFDTTYKCNQYKNPVTIIVGINHHGSTTIFGFAMLGDETVDTYTWVLETFIECMSGKLPATIVTDGDLAMKSAIGKVMVGTVHRLCSWHLTQNAISNVKDPGFLPWLKKMMKCKYDEKGFTDRWFAGITQFGLESNGWVSIMYEHRQSWAATFLQGHFFAGMLTTQRCEGMHAYLKTKVDKNSSILHFIRAIDFALSWLRMMEGKHDFESIEYRPVVGSTNLPSIETQVAKLYTHQLFLRVREEIKREGTYFATQVEEHADTISVTLVKYGQPKKVRQVSKSISTNTFSCECNKFPSEGIPCRHIFSSMKALQMTTLPECLLLKRWMKNEKAGRDNINDYICGGICNFPWSDQSTRYGHIISQTTELAYYASLSDELHKFAMVRLHNLTKVLQGMTNTCKNRHETLKSDRRWPDIKNPQVKKTKGAPPTYGNKSLRVCSKCKQPGHNKATCKGLKYDRNNDGNSSECDPNKPVDVNAAAGNYSTYGCREGVAVKRNLWKESTDQFPAQEEGCSVANESGNATYEKCPTQDANADFIIPTTSDGGRYVAEDEIFGGTPFGEFDDIVL